MKCHRRARSFGRHGHKHHGFGPGHHGFGPGHHGMGPGHHGFGPGHHGHFKGPGPHCGLGPLAFGSAGPGFGLGPLGQCGFGPFPFPPGFGPQFHGHPGPQERKGRDHNDTKKKKHGHGRHGHRGRRGCNRPSDNEFINSVELDSSSTDSSEFEQLGGRNSPLAREELVSIIEALAFRAPSPSAPPHPSDPMETEARASTSGQVKE